MFENFQRNFNRDSQDRRTHSVEILRPDIPGLREFFAAFAGASFRDGLYRVISPDDLDEWRERVCVAFPEFKGRVTCFGYDWLGTIFAVDSERKKGGQQGVVMFEPGTGEALEIPADLVTFHESELVTYGEAALAISFYERWRKAGASAPAYDQCVAYRKPLFLGGEDEVENLEISDLDVYWHIVGQLIQKTRGLPPGTPIRVSLD